MGLSILSIIEHVVCRYVPDSGCFFNVTYVISGAGCFWGLFGWIDTIVVTHTNLPPVMFSRFSPIPRKSEWVSAHAAQPLT